MYHGFTIITLIAVTIVWQKRLTLPWIYHSNINGSIGRKDFMYHDFAIVTLVCCNYVSFAEIFQWFYHRNIDCSNCSSLVEKIQFTMVLP